MKTTPRQEKPRKSEQLIRILLRMRNHSRLISGGFTLSSSAEGPSSRALYNMMCTAAVYPVVPSTRPAGFSKEDNRLYDPYITRRKWRPPLRLSPLFSDRLPTRFVFSPPSSFSSSSDRQPFDIVLSLPVEISLAIFSLISAQDLCK